MSHGVHTQHNILIDVSIVTGVKQDGVISAIFIYIIH